MTRTADRRIFLLEEDGEQRLFDPAELRQVLLGCFLGAGLRENCYLAEDIALAIEYAFLHSERENAVFARTELHAAVIRILENTGLSEVASIYRQGAPAALSVECRTDRETIGAILRRYLAGSAAHIESLTGQVVRAAALLKIEYAAPSLLVELARHYEASSPLPGIVTPTAVGRGNEFCTVSVAEIRQALDPAAARAVRDGVIRLHEVSRLFPSVRMFCFLCRFAERSKLEPPVTEMFLAPLLFELGSQLESCRRTVLQLFRDSTGNPAAELPLYVDLPDIADFSVRYLGAADSGRGKLEQEVAGMLIAPFACRIEKLRISPMR